VTYRDGILSEALAEALRPLIEEIVDETVERRLAELRPEPKKELYTLKEAGDFLGCSPDAARARANRGRLDKVHHGSRVYITGESLHRLAADGRG
jgi:Helix-turn-helix domain